VTAKLVIDPLSVKIEEIANEAGIRVRCLRGPAVGSDFQCSESSYECTPVSENWIKRFHVETIQASQAVMSAIGKGSIAGAMGACLLS
jgi:hypothetical protein